MDCIFCKIARKEMNADIAYEDEMVIAFNDIDPKAPQHILIIPRKHIATLNDIDTDDDALLAHMMKTAVDLAKQLGIAKTGYRILMNCNKGGGQAVFHIHLHLLGGRQLLWPPG